MYRAITAALILCVAQLIGCDAEQPSTPQQVYADLPDRLRSARAIEANNVSAVAIVSGASVDMQRVSGGFTAVLRVPARDVFDVELVFTEQVGGQPLTLATVVRSVETVDQNRLLNLRRAELSYDHDADGDGVNNLVEREQNTDPRDSSQTPSMTTIPVVANLPLGFSALNPDKYFAEATVNGLTRRLVGNQQQSGSFRVAAVAPVSAVVEYFVELELSEEEFLLIARQSSTGQVNQTIRFASNNYNTGFDQDSDGSSNIEEIFAATDPLVNENESNQQATLNIQFVVPAQIVNPSQVYDQLFVDGENVSDTLRRGNIFRRSITIDSGDMLEIRPQILANFEGQPYVLAEAVRTVSTQPGQRDIIFTSDTFNLNLDTDNDGIPNYLERENGSSPFVIGGDPGNQVSCTVAALPQLAARAAEQAVLSGISSFIDCGGQPYSLISSSSGFQWNESEDTVAWGVPGNVTADSRMVNLSVVNPSDQSAVYRSVQVTIRIEPGDCTADPVQVTLQPIADAYVANNTRVIDTTELRVQPNRDRSLIRFQLDPDLGVPDQATLMLSVADDSGEGPLTLNLLRDFDWLSSVNFLAVPSTSAVVAVASGVWQAGRSYQLGLSTTVLGTGDVTLIISMADGDDVAFGSTESAVGPRLNLRYQACSG